MGMAAQASNCTRKAIGARLILADVSTRSVWTTPYGTGECGRRSGAPYSDGTNAVSKEELKLLGHLESSARFTRRKTQASRQTPGSQTARGIRALDRLLELVQVDVLRRVPHSIDPSLPERLVGDDIASVRRRMAGRLLLIAHRDEFLTIDG